MSAHPQMTAVWRRAAEDLGFEFIAPFTLPDGHETLTYLGLVTQFGSPKGTLVIIGSHYDRHIRVAEQHGYGYSCFSEQAEPYDRESFIDVLNDWGWSGSPGKAPSWYSGEPWKS